VNTDPHDKPGMHWIALWADKDKCEILDSYGLPLDVYGTAEPIREWLDRHFKFHIFTARVYSHSSVRVAVTTP